MRTPEEEARIAIQGTATELTTARTISRKARIPNQIAAQAQVVVDTALENADLPPSTPPLSECPVPQNVAVVARAKVVGGIDIAWTPPQTGSPEYVHRARVRYRASGSTTWIELEADPLVGVRLRGLPEDTAASPKAYEAQGAFIDRYDRQSAWSSIVASQPETYIPFLSADRITSGMFTGATFTVAGTEASSNKGQMVFVGDAIARFSDGAADQIRLSKGGLELREAISQGTTQLENVKNSITPIDDDYAGLWFFRDPGGVGEPGRPRGLNIRAEGQGQTNINGRVAMVAVGYPDAPLSATKQYASLTLHSDGDQAGGGLTGAGVEGLAGALVRSALKVAGPARVNDTLNTGGAVTIEGTHLIFGGEGAAINSSGRKLTLATGGAGVELGGPLQNPGGHRVTPAWETYRQNLATGEVSINHNLGERPQGIAGLWKDAGQASWRKLQWIPEDATENGGAGNVYIRYTSTSTVLVRNARSNATDVWLYAWR